MRMKNGFSLIEVMIAITIIGVIGVISVSVFTQTLRTSSQTGELSNLKQNGELAMNILSESIRSAESVVCYGPPDNSIYLPPDNTRKNTIVLRAGDGKYMKFTFVDPTIVSGNVTVNGYISRQDNLDPAQLANFCTSLPPTGGFAITNNDPTSGVSVTGGKFLKLSGNLNKDSVSITFTVNPAKSTEGTGASETVEMQTTIQVR